jgi:hypothetical protein
MEMDDQNSFHDRIILSMDGTMNISFDLNLSWEFQVKYKLFVNLMA